MMSGRRGRWGKRAALVLGMAFLLVMSFPVLAENRWPKAEGYWLPEQASTYAPDIDSLFYGILYLTGAVFIATELLLLIFLIKYRYQAGRKGVYSHGSHRLEMIWTLVPAIILAGIAVIQKGTWDKIKAEIPSGPDAVHIKLYGEQFQWNFRYAGADGKWGTDDDIFEKNMLTVPVDKPIVIEQTSKDVIHSFFLPYMRLKQDLVPGMQIQVWFQATKSTKDMQSRRSPEWNYEVVCAELCGNGHSEMRGEMHVLDQKEYDEWLAKKSKEYADGKWEVNEKLWDTWKLNPDGTRKTEVAKAEGEKKEH